jgi:hypothetical protein
MRRGTSWTRLWSARCGRKSPREHSISYRGGPPLCLHPPRRGCTLPGCCPGRWVGVSPPVWDPELPGCQPEADRSDFRKEATHVEYCL